MGALQTILLPLFLGFVEIFNPNWQSQLCGAISTFAPISVCACDIFPSSSEILALDYDLDCVTDAAQLEQCVEFDIGALLPGPVADGLVPFLEGLGLDDGLLPAIEYCFSCNFDLSGTVAVPSFSGAFDTGLTCGLSQTGWPDVLPDLLPMDAIDVGVSGTINLDSGIDYTQCGGVTPSILDGTPIFGCTCSPALCGPNEILISCDIPLPVIGDVDLNDFFDFDSLSPLLGTCFSVPAPFA